MAVLGSGTAQHNSGAGMRNRLGKSSESLGPRAAARGALRRSSSCPIVPERARKAGLWLSQMPAVRLAHTCAATRCVSAAMRLLATQPNPVPSVPQPLRSTSSSCAPSRWLCSSTAEPRGGDLSPPTSSSRSSTTTTSAVGDADALSARSRPTVAALAPAAALFCRVICVRGGARRRRVEGLSTGSWLCACADCAPEQCAVMAPDRYRLVSPCAASC